jgi:hypothetical protein
MPAKPYSAPAAMHVHHLFVFGWLADLCWLSVQVEEARHRKAEPDSGGKLFFILELKCRGRSRRRCR